MWGFGDSASRRLIVAAAADQHDAVLAEEAGAGPTAVAAAARAAAATGATNALSALLSRRTVTELSMVMPNQHFLDSEVVNAVAQGQHGHRLLLSQPPVAIAACRLHPEALELLLRAGASLPPTIGDGIGNVPLLAYWASRLPDGGNHPAALPVLLQLLAAGADPLRCDPSPPLHQPEVTTRGRSGTCCSFLLTCACPMLLGEGVRHVLRQCAAEDGGRELSRQEVAVMLVAARLAGQQEEAEQLLADATLRPCFPAGVSAMPRATNCCRRPGARLPLSPAMRDKRRRLMSRRAFGLFMDDELEDGWDTDEERQWLVLSREHAAAAVAAGASDSETDSEEEGQIEQLEEEAEQASAAQRSRHLLRSMAHQLAALRRQGAQPPPNLPPADPDAPSTSAAAAAAGAAAVPTAGAAGASTSAAAAAAGASTSAAPAGQQLACSTSAAAASPSQSSPAGRRFRALHLRHMSSPAGSPRRLSSEGGGSGGGVRLLQAQLVADCASYNLLDVLHLLLSQGASPSQPVPWVHPADSSPAARAAREAHEHMHVPGGERTPLALAAAAGHAEAVAALRRRGAFLDLASLRHAGAEPGAEEGAEEDAGGRQTRDGGCARLLGSQLDIPALSPVHHSTAAHPACPLCPTFVPPAGPVLLLLQRHQELAARAMAEAAAAELPRNAPHNRTTLMLMVRAQLGTAPPNWPPGEHSREAAAVAGAQARAAPQLARLEARALRIMDCLHEAGYRMRVFKDHCGMCADGIWRMGRVEGLQPRELAQLDVQGRNRLLWQAYCRADWSSTSHATFPPAFRAAAKTLLLAARYGGERQLLSSSLCGELSEEESGADCGLPCQDSSPDSSASGSTVVAAAVGGESPGMQPLDADACAGAVAAAGLAMLPQELVFKIISEAAYPLSTWVRE